MFVELESLGSMEDQSPIKDIFFTIITYQELKSHYSIIVTVQPFMELYSRSLNFLVVAFGGLGEKENKSSGSTNKEQDI